MPKAKRFIIRDVQTGIEVRYFANFADAKKQCDAMNENNTYYRDDPYEIAEGK